MNDEFDWVKTLVAWLPLIALMAVWVFYMRRMGGAGLNYGQYLEKHLDEQKRHNDVLEKILLRMPEKPGS